MPIRLVEEGPRSWRLRRLLGLPRMLIGLLFVLAGVLVAALPMFFVLLALDPEFRATLGESIGDALWPSAIAAVIAWGLLYVGVRLLRGKRHTVLFLRRFGFSDAWRVINAAVRTAVGRRSRLVTLDDADVAPVGVSAGSRVGLGVLTVVGGIALVWIVGWLSGGGLSDIATELMDTMSAGAYEQAYQQALEEGSSEIMAAISGAIASIFVIFIAAMIAAVVMVLVVIPMAIAGSAALFSGRAFRAALKGEAGKSLVIDSADDIPAATRTIARNSRQVFGARLVVARVDSAIWRDVVLAVAGVSRAVIIDVSEPTGALLWEVESLERTHRDRRILVARRDRAEILAASPTTDSPDGDPTERLAGMLADSTVLVYDEDRPKDFAVALRRWLDTVR